MEHRCISCGGIDSGPDRECFCMEPGPPCGVCGCPLWEPLTPWKSNDHWAEDGHEWIGEDGQTEDQYFGLAETQSS